MSLPDYLSLFTGQTRLRSTHLDRLSFVSTLLPRGKSTSLLDKSFFFRVHSLWNDLPLEIREIGSPSIFKSKLTTHLWDSLKQADPAIGNDGLVDFIMYDND